MDIDWKLENSFLFFAFIFIFSKNLHKTKVWFPNISLGRGSSSGHTSGPLRPTNTQHNQSQKRAPTGGPKRVAHPQRPSSATPFANQPSSALFDDDSGIMSEIETSATGFRRGGKVRSSLPIVRTHSETEDRSLGLVFLQFRSETKRALLPNEITSWDTVKALFVRYSRINYKLLSHFESKFSVILFRFDNFRLNSVFNLSFRFVWFSSKRLNTEFNYFFWQFFCVNTYSVESISLFFNVFLFRLLKRF